MTSDPVSVVRANNVAFNDMDVDGMLALYAEDAEVVDRRRVGMGTFRGHAELRPFYLGIFHSATTLHEDLDVVAEDGDIVVAHCELTGQLVGAPQGAADATATYGLIVTVRDGLIRRLDIADDGEHALELSGLGRGSSAPRA